MHVQVPEECQHQASDYRLKKKPLVAEQRINQAEDEQHADSEQQQTGYRREQEDQRRKP
jgi:hypothetical protein